MEIVAVEYISETLMLAPAIIAFVITLLVSIAMTAFCVVLICKLIKRQIKLFNSIVLVQLKSAKLHYLIFIAVVSMFIIFLLLSVSDASSYEFSTLERMYSFNSSYASILLMFVLLLLVSIDVLLVMLFLSKSAVVDRGIYTALNYLDWYHVHDYIIDEGRGVVVLSAQKETFATLKGTTAPLKVMKNDIPKLKFILNKNKNKFSSVDNEV